jgi:6-pyruvoyltetrahydropterin/6-carboxytetrahydropterin synthase
MFTIVKKLAFCYGHRLMDYEGPCSHPHGHNAILEIELQRPTLNETGMVIDFAEVDAALRAFINDEIDHRMLLRGDDPLVDALTAVGECPFIMQENPTAENIARLVFEKALSLSLPVVSVKLWETPEACAEYRTDVPR